MDKFILVGTVVNTVAVILGASIGLLLKSRIKSKREGGFGDRLSKILMCGLALCVLVIGIEGAIKIQNPLIMIISVVLGAIIGEAIDIDKWINLLGEKIEIGMKGRFSNVAVGYVTASLVFCVGSLSIVGPLRSGLFGDHSLQYTKSVLDLVSSVIFASSLGFGVLLAASFVFVFQGSITLLASVIAPFLTSDIINEMSAVGSLMVIAVGLNVLGITKIKVMNFTPAIFMPIFLVPLFEFIAKL